MFHRQFSQLSIKLYFNDFNEENKSFYLKITSKHFSAPFKTIYIKKIIKKKNFKIVSSTPKRLMQHFFVLFYIYNKLNKINKKTIIVLRTLHS